MRLIHGVLGLLMLSGGAVQAGWPCDICICPKIKIWENPETETSFWECEEHTCETDCDCGTSQTVFRYYSLEQYEGDCSYDCQVYCEQIVVSLNNSSMKAPTGNESEAAEGRTAGNAAVRVAAEASKPRAAKAGKVKRKSVKLKEVGKPMKPDLDNFEIKINDKDFNPHLKKATTDAASVCYLKVKSDIGGELVVKLMKVTFEKQDGSEIERWIGYEVAREGQPLCASEATSIKQVQASEETEINNTNTPVHVIDGLYLITVDGVTYLVRTKNVLEEK